MRERSNGMEGIGDVQDATLGLVVQVQALRQKVARLIRLMREAGELPEEKAEGLLGLIAGPLEEQEPDSAADMNGAALPEAGAEAPPGAGGGARAGAPSRRRAARMARRPGAAQDPEDGGSQA
jgi:hypothetical protein